MSSPPRCIALLGCISLAFAAISLGCAPRERDNGAAVGSRVQAAQSCGAIGYVGCCEGDTLRYCSPGGDGGAALQTVLCPAGCGYEPSFSVYLCGGPLAEDPTGAAPRACPPGPGGDGGPTDAGGTDAGGPDAGPLDASPAEVGPDAASGADASGCQGIGYVGCCAGTLLRFCVGGVLLSLDCAGSPSCGWDGQRKLYACSTSGSPDPSGNHPLGCPAGAPDGGASFDSAPDSAPASLEAGVADGGAEAGLDAAGDGAPELGPRDSAAEVVSGDSPAGLELRAFEAGSSDASTIRASGGGCSCDVGSTPGPGGLLGWIGLLAVLALRRLS